MKRSFFERLTDELPRLYRDARRLTRTSADAEDLAQATVVRAIEKRATLRDDERLRAWLLRVQRSVFLNSTRGLARKLEVIEGGRGAERVPEPTVDFDTSVEAFDDRLDGALSKLAPEWREVLILREVEELSYEEIAAVQQCPVGTVRSRLARARAAIAERFEELADDSRTTEVRHARLRS